MASGPRLADTTRMATARLPARLRPALLAAAVVIAFAPGLRAPFFFDDEAAVLRNPTIRTLASRDILRPPADGGTTTGRPLVNASFALDHALWGANPAGYRATNIGIHLGATLVLFALLRRTFRARPLASRVAVDADSAAWFGTLLWAVHPLQSQSVTAIAQRTESLCGLLYLATLLAFARHAEAKAAGSRAASRWRIAAAVFCAAGMAVKEVMVTAPVVVLLYDRTFVSGTFQEAWRRHRGCLLALAAAWLLLAALLFAMGGTRGAAAGFGHGVSSWHYLLTQSEALVLYLRLAFWPHPLVLDHGTAVVTSASAVLTEGILVLTALAATGWALVHRPVAGFAAAAAFIVLAPSSSFVPLVAQTVAEHRVYLPLAALAATITVLSGRLGPARSWVLGICALALTATTIVRNRTHLDPVALWRYSLEGRPGNARAHNNLALALRDAGDPAAARVHFVRAAELDSPYVPARYNHGVLELAEGRLKEAEVLFNEALRLAPEHPDARLNLGITLVRAGRAAEAVPLLEAAARGQPAADTHFNLGVALATVGRLNEAEGALRAASQRDPGLAEAHYQLGRLAERRGRAADARHEFERALKIDPRHAESHRRLGLLAARSDDLAAAERHFSALANLLPSDADAHANIGNVHLLTGRIQEAISRFETALRLRPGDERLRESLERARGERP
ncbi:MAG: hypothetical protein RLZZ188_869 [Verrucomicrobiota bacterium]